MGLSTGQSLTAGQMREAGAILLATPNSSMAIKFLHPPKRRPKLAKNGRQLSSYFTLTIQLLSLAYPVAMGLGSRSRAIVKPSTSGGDGARSANRPVQRRAAPRTPALVPCSGLCWRLQAV